MFIFNWAPSSDSGFFLPLISANTPGAALDRKWEAVNSSPDEVLTFTQSLVLSIATTF
jgi:hypothetical protein